MNHTDSLGAKQLFTPLRFRCQQVFFIFAKVFFAAPSGQLVGARETYVSFSNPRQELFCHPGKFLFPSPFRTWPARWRERLYAPFRPHRQAFFRKKSKKCFRTVKKALTRHGSLIFNPLSKTIRLCAKKVKYFILFFIQYEKTDDKYVVFSKCCLFSACHKKSPFRRRGLYCRKADQCVSRCHMIKKTEPTVMAQARSIFQVSISPPSSQPKKMPMTGTTYS